MNKRIVAVAGLALMVLLAVRVRFAAAAEKPDGARSKVATSLSTFNCLSIYWSPPGGEAAKKVLIQFRRVGEDAWHDGLPMRYNPVKSPECKGDYRGSIVNLTPNTTYEINLTLQGTPTRTSLKATTWNENFPIGQTVKVPSGDTTVAITKSGSPTDYVLYDGTGSTIDTRNKADSGITVNANYVILRGFTIRHVKTNGITIINGHHLVIENCDISKWGSEDVKGTGFGVEMNAGVYCKNRNMHAVVIQRCKIHNPTWNTNSWAQDHYPGKSSKHPAGPQTIVFWETQGNNVIRYNECWSDKDHYFDDVMGGAFNAGYRGWPGADSDIYGNYVANCYDDGIEAEGGGQNVRIWDNYIENTMMTIANAAVSIGPLYIWQNVGGRSYSPPGSLYGMTNGDFMKMGYADGVKWMTGHMYVFNNTIWQPKGQGASGMGGESRIIKHCVSRNNIFNVRPGDTRSISTEKKSADNDFDHDLLSAPRVPPGQEKHGIKGVPRYVEGAGFNFDTMTGNFAQTPESPGYHTAVVIPDFCDPVKGPPDMGAQQSGTPPIVYGVKADFVPPVLAPAKDAEK